MKKDHWLFALIVLIVFLNIKFSSTVSFWGFSEFMHFGGGVLFSILVGWRWKRINPESFQKSKFFERFFQISAGAIWWLVFWELFEYIFFSFGVWNAEIYHDTMRDFMMDFLGSFIVTLHLSQG